MSFPLLRRHLVGSALAVGFVLCGAPWGTGQTASAQEQTLFMAFTDVDGAPVRDMTADEIVIQWDEVPCEILEIEPLDWPMRVTVFVDNATESHAAMPDMREGLRLFLNRLPPDIEVAIATIGRRPQFLIQHTTDRAELADALGGVISEGGAATFFDALYEEAERLDEDREPQYLPAIVMVAIGGSEGSLRTGDEVINTLMDRLYDNGAVVYTALFSAPYGVGGVRGRGQSRWGTDLAAATRGRYEEIVVPTRYRTILPEFAADIARRHRLVRYQYRVTYRPPEDASDQPRVQAGTTRTGLVTLATDNGNIP